jgi:hypothetical protein
MPVKAMYACTLLTCAAVLAVAGCGGKTWTMNDNVEGIVKLDGTPVPRVTVQFWPDDPQVQGPSSSATTDDKGHFQLACDDGRTGAVIGKHNVVVIVGRTETGGPTTNLPVPPAYRLASQTPLQVQVTVDQHTYDLELKRSASARK